MHRAWKRLLRRHPGGQEDEERLVATAVPQADDLARQIGAQQLSEAREELSRADGKASILLAGTGVGVGAVLGGMLSAQWAPASLGDPWAFIWVAGFGLVLVGIACLVVAVYPRWERGRDDEAEMYFFGHAAKKKSTADIEAAIRRTAKRPLLRTADQLMHVSRIIERKYSWVQRGIWALVLGTSVIGVAVVGSAISR